MDGKKREKSERLGTVREEWKTLQIYYKYYKNISEIFQIVLTFWIKCNIYNTKKTHK